MAGQPLIATISGIPNAPEVNVRSGPNVSFQLLFKTPKGTSGLRVIEVQGDSQSAALNGKVYQWFRLLFADGQQGWVRDDLITVVGDGAAFGYGIFTAPAVPFYVVRGTPTAASGTMSVQAAPQVTVQPAQVVMQPAPTVTVTTPTTVSSPGTQVVVQPAPQVMMQPAQQMMVQPVQQVAAPSTTTTTVTVSVPNTAATPVVSINTSGPATAICMNKGGANVRPGPGQNNNPVLLKFNYRDTAQILEVKQGDNNDYFKWLKINYQGKQGWVREDFVRFSGTISGFGYAEDLYPCPAPDAWWSRDFDLTGQVSGLKHDGWDHAGTIGTAIMAGPRGGVVTKTQFCQKCGPEGASSVDKGFSMGDSRVWNDAGWNYGYGHYMVVRYDNHLLPASTQQFLGAKGWGGYHAFVMYAHLHQILAQAGQSVTGSQQIGKLGNSGNSTGAHLHLELRFGQDPNAQWPNIKAGLESPVRLFFR